MSSTIDTYLEGGFSGPTGLGVAKTGLGVANVPAGD